MKIKIYGLSTLLVLLLVIITITVFTGCPQNGGSGSDLIIHYYRTAGDYTDWSLWVWPVGGAGAWYEQTGSDGFGAIFTIPNSYFSGYSQIGMIINRGTSWGERDGGDRIYTIANGNEIYLVQGSMDFFYSPNINGISYSEIVDNTDWAEIVIKFVAPINIGGYQDNVVLTEDGVEKNIISVTDMQYNSTGESDTMKVIINDTIDWNAVNTIDIPGFDLAYLTPSFPLIESDFFYSGGDLGATYLSASLTTFKLWAPKATKVVCDIYDTTKADASSDMFDLTRGDKGVWSYDFTTSDLKNKFYSYRVTNNGTERQALDPYAVSMDSYDESEYGDYGFGRGAIIDLTNDTNPTGWAGDLYYDLTDDERTNAIVYEIHVRDFTIDPSSGVATAKRGTFSGFIDKLDYIQSLGVTHIQLMPVIAFYNGNEEDQAYEASGISPEGGSNYNWGYDPHNYFSPDGWFSSNPGDPVTRVKELKELVKACHDRNMGVLLDVVYNHTAAGASGIFENVVPNYYHRYSSPGNILDESGAGSSVATEKNMVRKLVKDSMKHWVNEYHIDGFRFDLMGLLDITTLNEAFTEITTGPNPNLLLVGEPWNMGATLAYEDRYIQDRADEFDNVAMFGDKFRDNVKGSTNGTDGGWCHGGAISKTLIYQAITGDIYGYTDASPDIDLVEDLSDGPFGDNPGDVYNYLTAHDNYTFHDKMLRINISDSVRQLATGKLGLGILFTSQGTAFMHAGNEFLREKTDGSGVYDENSYDSGDDVNGFDWTRKDNADYNLVSYTQGLIQMRKQHPAFRMYTGAQVKANIDFIPNTASSVIAYNINGGAVGDSWNDIYVVLNNNATDQTTDLGVDVSSYTVVVNSVNAGVSSLGTVGVADPVVKGRSILVIYD